MSSQSFAVACLTLPGGRPALGYFVLILVLITQSVLQNQTASAQSISKAGALGSEQVSAPTSSSLNNETSQRSALLRSTSVKYASVYNWQQSPQTPAALATGSNTITLQPCPAGVFIKPTYYDRSPEYIPTHYVWIAGTGTPEAALARRVSGWAGDATCQISVTARNTHGAGYTVGTASGGIKEASESARSWQGWGTQGGHVIIDATGSPYRIYAPLHFEVSAQTVDVAGGVLYCYVSTTNGWKDDDCVVVGQRQSQNTVQNITLNNFVFHAANGNTTNFAFDAINVNAQHTILNNPQLTQSATAYLDPATIPVGSFNSLVSVCDDEAFVLDGAGQGTASTGLRTDRRGQLVYGLAQGDHTHGNVNGCFGVGWLKHIDASMQCGGNSIKWLSGNGVRVSDSVIQGFNQFGLMSGQGWGGYNGNAQVDNTYFEVGGCSGASGNVDYVAAGATGSATNAQAGVIMNGGTLWMRGSTGASGWMPTFQCSGSAGTTVFDYWVVPHPASAPSGQQYSRAWIPVGATSANCSGTVDVYYPATVSGNIPGPWATDLLRTARIGGQVQQPYYNGVPGGSVTAAGSVALNLPASGHAIEKYTDNVANVTASYLPFPYFYDRRFVGVFTNFYLSWLPGNYVLLNSARLVSDPNESNVVSAGIVTTDGPYNPVAWGLKDLQVTNGISTHLGDRQSATILQDFITGYQRNFAKGRLNFWSSEASAAYPGSVITLVDSNPAKTAATSGYRPLMDAADVWIGIDSHDLVSRNVAPLAMGSPVSISYYINVVPDGISWKERLTVNMKQFNVPISAKGGSANHVTCWKADGQTLGYCSTAPAADGSCTCE